MFNTCSLFCSDEPPKVTCQPTSLCKVFPGRVVSFTVQATGSRPLSYHWQWKRVEEEGSSEKWQPCDAEWSDGTTLTIPSCRSPMKGATAVLLATALVTRFPIHLKLRLVDLLLAKLRQFDHNKGKVVR